MSRIRISVNNREHLWEYITEGSWYTDTNIDIIDTNFII